MILVKNCQFFHLFNIGIPPFLGNIGEENVFYNIVERKKPFSAIKTRFSKRRKMKIFPKGFWSKNWTFFDLFFLSKQARKMCVTIFQNEKTLFQAKKSSKSRKNRDFSKAVNQWFWSKNGHFSMVFFKYNISQENVFYDILKRKNAFLGYKNKKIKKSKN